MFRYDALLPRRAAGDGGGVTSCAAALSHPPPPPPPVFTSAPPKSCMHMPSTPQLVNPPPPSPAAAPSVYHRWLEDGSNVVLPDAEFAAIQPPVPGSDSFAASRRAAVVTAGPQEPLMRTPAPTPALPDVEDAATQTTVDADDGGAPVSRPPFQERLASLALSRLQADMAEQQRQWDSERAHAPSKAQLDAASGALAAEQSASAALRAALDDARQQAADRAEELQAALNALQETRKQLQQRASEVSHWRAESARAVGHLDAMTSAFEKQTARVHAVEGDAADARRALAEVHETNDMQRHALNAAAQAVAEQQSATLAIRQRLASHRAPDNTPNNPTPRRGADDSLRALAGPPFALAAAPAISVTVRKMSL